MNSERIKALMRIGDFCANREYCKDCPINKECHAIQKILDTFNCKMQPWLWCELEYKKILLIIAGK